ncbi:PMT6 [Candida theae]|uniref:dolichyl-phosphate-mannose--protein mannosyltransferase n=1 Tax=Candida theae TaxID=1198502 RepID=A0AAD5BBX0_9ASCO|nr:PMT6 [Candida theae]KAI5950385.1 PMT6 [Candida theae]
MEIYKITSPKDWSYFANGSANILFKYTGTNDYLTHKLLRLRLLKEDEEYISTCELYDFIELKCKHLFPKQIIDIQLIVLTSEFVRGLDSAGFKLQLNERYGLLIPNILDGNYTKISLSKHCQLYLGSEDDNKNNSNSNSNSNTRNTGTQPSSNQNLEHDPQSHAARGVESNLASSTHDAQLFNPNLHSHQSLSHSSNRSGNTHDPNGHLVNGSMASSPLNSSTPINSIIFEIKPKWLYDNKSSNYCRTCSLNQLRNVPRHFCPLDLLYPQTINQGLDDIFSKIPPEIIDLIEVKNQFPLKQLFYEFLSNPDQNVFAKLKQYQKINNKNDLIENLTSSHDVSQNLSLVMTLRDVGLFIKFEKYDRNNNIHNSHNNINNLITLPPAPPLSQINGSASLNSTPVSKPLHSCSAQNPHQAPDEQGNRYLITCNIYDLDLKSRMKYKHWLQVEHELQGIYNSNNPNWRHCCKKPASLDHPQEPHTFNIQKDNAYDEDEEIRDIIDKTSKLQIKSKSSLHSPFTKYVSPLVLTALSALVRIYHIDAAKYVVWDEAHFGKFGSHYLKREIYFDVHPPLGKLLVALSGYLAGYDGSFEFESGKEYPDGMDFVFMRVFNCLFGILVTPLTYRTAVLAGFDQWTCWFISLMVIFEQISLTLSKFILLDSMLLFFTVFTFFCLMNLHKVRSVGEELSKEGIKWLVLTGISIGCVCSVKWVGLFVTALVGLYTGYDLMIKFFQLTSTNTMNVKTYVKHWVLKSATLIIIPILLYMVAFKVHFMVLNHTGPGDGSISTLLQASLKGNNLQFGPRTVAGGSIVTIRSQGLSPNLLHSHHHVYPEGSGQQQATTYGFKDVNNEFEIELVNDSGLGGLVTQDSPIRIKHSKTGNYLEASPIAAPITKQNYEISLSPLSNVSISAHDWILDIQAQEPSPSDYFKNENKLELHPISTAFRLKHKDLGCYLATTGNSLPSWGYQQGEVVCKYPYFVKDKTTWWNVEEHRNEHLEPPAVEYVPPKPKFWREFVLVNYGMLASNNALVPDPDKFDKLSSEWWEWPILNTGLRMCGWGDEDTKYFLIGNPVVTWLSNIGLLFCMVYMLFSLLRYQRQSQPSANSSSCEVAQCVLPFSGWILHYVPFIVMGRVKYLHHYVPALYFAIFSTGFLMHKLVWQNRYLPQVVKIAIYLVVNLSIVFTFWYLRDLAFGMKGSSKQYQNLRLLSSWMI